MSNIYIQEPPTDGKILLHTTVGDIDIELWSKEAPKACRNFVQLCMEGYYDGVIFHRVVKDFIVQGGDPTGTGEGGESIYGHPFKDEFHSRLRCNRRGLVAMANSGPHDNGSQFFFTLGPAPELNNKHTIFGKVTGNTIYNMIKLVECEVGSDERPLYPCEIHKTEILSNPYNDIIPRENKRAKKEEKEDKKSKSKSKATKNFSLLSFGEEAEEDEVEVNKAIKDIRVKSKSSHDLSDDPNLSSVPVMEPQPRESAKRSAVEMESGDIDKSPESEAEKKSKVDSVKKKLKKEPEEKSSAKKEKTDTTTTQPEIKKEEADVTETQTSRSDELREEAKKLKKEIKESRKKPTEPPPTKEGEDEKVEDGPQNDAIATYRQERQKYKDLRKEQKKKGSGREEVTLSILKDFQAKLNAAKTVASGYSDDEPEEEDDKNSEEEEEDVSDMSWMRHKLHFDDKHIKVLDANITDVDRYEIQDPRNPITKRRREASKQTLKGKR